MKLMISVVLLGTVLALPVLAQDSVSKNIPPATPGLPGDALTPWDTAQQCANFVVDLVPFKASWGTYFKIAPLLKSSKASFYDGSSPPQAKEYFDDLISAQSTSRLQALGVQYPVANYKVWDSQPGYGIHPTLNFTPNATAPSGLSNQFGAVFADYGRSGVIGNAAVNYTGIIGAVVNYNPAAADRLYVHRVQAATNGTSALVSNAAFGVGAVDEQGNAMFRADNSGASGGNILTGNNIFRVGMLARTCGTVNSIDNAGMADAGAGTWIVQHDATIYNTPNIGPVAKFGSPAFLLGSNFGKQYAYGPTNPPTTTMAHLGTALDHRGGVVYLSKNVSCIAGTNGTAAIIGKSTTVSADPATKICLWGLNANASVGGTMTLDLPAAAITDPTTGVQTYSPVAIDHYHSQVAYNGGNGPIAIGLDQQGRLLVAMVLYWTTGGTGANPFNDIVCARITCGPTPTVQWTLVGYSTDSAFTVGSGKPIYGPGGLQIGHMEEMDYVTSNGVGGGSPFGPSVSAPMIDSVGNVWFVSGVYFTHFKDGTIRTIPDYDSALLRAVYNPTNFSYTLEEVLEPGDVFLGKNSGLNYRINFMEIADSNSVSSGTAWSSNMSEKAYLGGDPKANLPTRHPSAMGGMVLSTTIIYDVDGDGYYNDPTSQYYDNTKSADEAYSVLMYITAGCVRGDENGDGVINNQDIDGFIQALFHQSDWELDHPDQDLLCVNDINGDGAVNNQDIDGFISLLFGS